MDNKKRAPTNPNVRQKKIEEAIESWGGSKLSLKHSMQNLRHSNRNNHHNDKKLLSSTSENGMFKNRSQTYTPGVKIEEIASKKNLPSINEIAKKMSDPETGVPVKARKKKLKNNDKSFHSKDAVIWMKTNFNLSYEEAIQLGRKLVIEKKMAPVYPPAAVFDSSDNLFAFVSIDEFLGLLQIQVIEGNGLLASNEKANTKEMFGKIRVLYSDGPKTGQSIESINKKVKTKKIKSTENPKWDFHHSIPINVSIASLTMNVAIYEYGRGKDEFLGHIEIPLEVLNTNKTIDDWYQLEKKKLTDEVRGEIHLKLDYLVHTEIQNKNLKNEEIEIVEEEQIEIPSPKELISHLKYEFDDPSKLNDAIFQQEKEGGKLTLKAASLVKIIEILTNNQKKGLKEVDLMENIIVAYRSFTDPISLLNCLILRFNGPPPLSKDPTATELEQHQTFSIAKQNIQMSLSSFLTRWNIKNKDFSDDFFFAYLKRAFDEGLFSCNPGMSKYIYGKFFSNYNINLNTEGSYKIHHSEVQELRLKQEVKMTKPSTSSRVSIFGTLPSNLSLHSTVPNVPTHQINLLKFDENEIAEQLTLIEHELIRRIEPKELLKQNWNKHSERSIHVIDYITWFNKICQWAATEIMKEETPEQRAFIITKFIMIANRLLELRNYNGVMEILASLEGSAIRRLKNSWAVLPKNYQADLEKLANLMKPTKNFKEYRAALDSPIYPCIPYLGLHLTDLTFIDDGNDDTVQNGLINIEKLDMTSRVCTTVLSCVATDYSNLKHRIALQKMLQTVEVWEDNEIYRLSKIREPPGEQKTHITKKSTTMGNVAKDMLKKSNVSASKDLSPEDWNMILSTATLRVFKKDEPIIRQGKLNKQMFKIKTGKVRVEKFVGDENGSVIPLGMMEPGRVFGEMSIIVDNNHPTISCVANEDGVEVYALDYKSLHKVFDQNTSVARRFYFWSAKKLSEILVNLVPKKKSSSSDIHEKLKSDSVDIDNGPVNEDQSEGAKYLSLFNLPKDKLYITKYDAKFRKYEGNLIIFQDYICFLSEMFMNQTKKVFPINKITKVEHTQDSVVLRTTSGVDPFFTFSDHIKLIEAHQIIEQIWYMTSLSGETSEGETIQENNEIVEKTTEGDSEKSDKINLNDNNLEKQAEGESKRTILTSDDWDLILNGAKHVKYGDGEKIIHVGENYQKIYYITKGTCYVVVDRNGELVPVNVMKQGTTFGEMSFINMKENGEYNASATVVAKGEVELSVIQGYFINILFSMHVGFEKRFFEYLCDILAQRINKQTQNLGN